MLVWVGWLDDSKSCHKTWIKNWLFRVPRVKKTKTSGEWIQRRGGLVRMSFLFIKGGAFFIFLASPLVYRVCRVLAKDCSGMSWRSLAINFSFNWYLAGFDIYFGLSGQLNSSWTDRLNGKLDGAFKIFFLIFTPKLGEDSHPLWRADFFRWVESKPPTTNHQGSPRMDPRKEVGEPWGSRDGGFPTDKDTGDMLMVQKSG